ncbi:MAG: N-acetylglucosamine-6-phosphate deacetylase [Nitriliruptoraceae bacterium]
MQVLSASRLLLDDVLVEDGWVSILDGRIQAAGTGPPPAAPTSRLDDGVLAPGLVDAQCNGAFGVDLVDADDAAWDLVLRSLPSTGVTAVVPTFITAPIPRLVDALRRAAARIQAASEDHPPGRASALGVHVEGPFLNERRRGAHDADLLRDPDDAAIDALLEAGGDALLYVTLAPERDGALDAVARFVRSGVRVAVGHSDASDDVVRAAADAGATLVTHLYNAQRPLAHRDPGVVGAALTDPRLTAGLIVDLYHVAPTAVRLAFAAATGRIMLVTDAIAALGMPPGRYDLGGRTTIVRDGRPPVREDGVLAGSDLRLDEAVGNAVRCGIAPETALLAATRVPADALGRDDVGRIVPGARADLVWLGPDWRARRTWIAGEAVTPHSPGGAAAAHPLQGPA